MASSKKTAPDPDSRREQLLHRIEETFLHDGFRRTTVAEMAATLRCSRRALYELAPGKEDLFIAVLDRVLGRIEHDGAAGAASAKSTGEKIFAFIEPGLTELRGATPAFFADIAAYPPAAKRLQTHQNTREKDLRKLIAKGVRSGECRRVHAEVAARAMLAAYRAVTDPAFLSNVNVSLSESVAEARDLFLQGLLHPDD